MFRSGLGMSNLGLAITLTALSLPAAFASSAFADDQPKPCTREWAKAKIENQSFKVIGLGLSTRPDSRQAADEAKAEAIKDILTQLKTDVESQSNMTKTTSSATFNSETVLTSKLDDLKGLKPVKSGSNPQENIRDCEVYEFNVQSAYDEMRGRVSPLTEKLQAAAESQGIFAPIKAYSTLKQSVDDALPDLRRADAFKTVLGRPGPGWEEQAEKSLNTIEDNLRKAKDRIWFLLPGGKFESASAEVEGKLSNSGVHVAQAAGDIADGAMGVQVNIKELGTPRKSKTSMGLTVSRKVMVQLVDMKTKKTLSTNRGLNVVGTSASGDADDAMANSDAQITAAIVDAIRAFLPQLTQ